MLGYLGDREPMVVKVQRVVKNDRCTAISFERVALNSIGIVRSIVVMQHRLVVAN